MRLLILALALWVWGLWGVFFAIPLATLLKAVINAWPRRQGRPERIPEG